MDKYMIDRQIGRQIQMIDEKNLAEFDIDMSLAEQNTHINIIPYTQRYHF